MYKPFTKYNIYGFRGIIRLTLNLVKTKLFFPKARLIRSPIEIRGKRFIKFGDNVEINDYVHIASISSVILGNNVLVASKVYISDIQHGYYSGEDQEHSSPNLIPNDRPLTAKPINIEENVWLGESVSVMPGVTIGKGTIVGANSVVSRSLPPNVIAVGSPAKPIKKFNFETRKWEKI